MKTIVYIIPYFGKFPDFFPVWLHSCRNNPTVDWLIFTDDKTAYDYPENVKVKYFSFDEIRLMFQKHFDYPISLKRPYKLCDYKPLYGLVFQDFIKEYNFWGFCDIDLIFGNIRHFLTDNILNNYEKIGFLGHSTLMRNNERMNTMFRNRLDDERVDKYLQSEKNEFVDESFFLKLCRQYNVKSYDEYIFAGLSSLSSNFVLTHASREDHKCHNRFIFSYVDGTLTQLSAVKGEIEKKEYLYVHFLKRDMDVYIDYESDRYLIIPNRLVEYREPTFDYIMQNSAPHVIYTMIKRFRDNAHKLTLRNFIPILSKRIMNFIKLYLVKW